MPDAPPQRSAAEQAGLTPGMAPGTANILPTATSEALLGPTVQDLGLSVWL